MTRQRDKNPPDYALRFFRWFCRPDIVEDIEGDLIERFNQQVNNQNLSSARRAFFFQIVKLFRPNLIRSFSFINNHPNMYRHNLKIATRQMQKSKLYSAIKIGGFAIGISACILIALFIRDELSYDQHYVDGAQIYRVLSSDMEDGKRENWPSFPAALAQVLRENMPGIGQVGRLIPYDFYAAGANQLRRADQKINTHEEGFVYMDQELLDILEIPMAFGVAATALKEPKSIVISATIADKYFGDENPIGKQFILNEEKGSPYTIGGVMKDFPTRSHLQSDFLLSLTDVEFWPGEQSTWKAWNYDHYVKVEPGVDIDAMEKKLLFVRDDYLTEPGKEEDPMLKNYRIHLQPVSDIHLNTFQVGDNFTHGDMGTVRLFGAIAFIILLLACINFINLSTAKSANRAKEVGLRKVVGSNRNGLIRQFLHESTLFSFISLIMGIAIAWISLPFLNNLADKSLTLPWKEWWFLPGLLGSTLFIGLLAGLYPAYYLSAFKPIEVVQGKVSKGVKNTFLRSGLVVFQFAASIILIICALVVNKQMNFLLDAKLGYEKDQVVLLQGANTLGDQLATLKSELIKLPSVSNATVSHYWPISKTKRDRNMFWLDGRKEIDQPVGGQKWVVDENYLPTLGMKIISGRNFSTSMPSDSQAIVINQEMARLMAITKPSGQLLTNGFQKPFHVIGIVEDFHFESLREKVGPLAFRFGGFGEMIGVKVSGKAMDKTLASIGELWDQFSPNQPLSYSFLDERYEKMYADVKQSHTIFFIFALLAIFIACLGLFALAAFMAQQRGKEIGIRKVLGASTPSLFGLLSVDFLKLVGVAFLISIPIAWYLMSRWIENFEYQTAIQWWIFVLAGFLAVGIALLTISKQALSAAMANPIKSIRNQ